MEGSWALTVEPAQATYTDTVRLELPGPALKCTIPYAASLETVVP